MKQETTEERLLLRSLFVLRVSRCPERVRLCGIIRNGKTIRRPLRLACQAHPRNFIQVKFHRRCAHCGSTRGVLCLWEESLFAVCLGLSCLKNLYKADTT